jgi:hypothetical protein
MHVVAHETPPQEAGLRIQQVFSQEPKIGAAVLIGRVNFSPIDAALCDVAGHTDRWRRGRCRKGSGIIAQFRLTSFLDEFFRRPLPTSGNAAMDQRGMLS